MAQVVPRGLRSFDAGDADFFPDLLPGQRNRDGLPESIAFWKKGIEDTDSEQTFSVGLIYGPSGCGKSSLVRAGLLPHLSDSVIAVYVEATPDETETRILRGLRKRLPELSEDAGLADTLAAVRRAQGGKVVIIIDQFEQWLHAHSAAPDAELVKALRQCDGGRLQAVVMVRDDFSMAASRFMRSLDTRIVEGHNFAAVDLFDLDHARKVLVKFGQAFGKLPANAGHLSDAERQFVDGVASGLSQDDRGCLGATGSVCGNGQRQAMGSCHTGRRGRYIRRGCQLSGRNIQYVARESRPSPASAGRTGRSEGPAAGRWL